MLRLTIPFVVTLGACLVVPQVRGQGRIEMPTKNGIEQEIPDRFLLREQRRWLVWAAYEGYRPRTRWSETAPPVPLRFLKFMDPFYVLHEHQGADGNYLLLGEASVDGSRVERAIGWVRKDCLLESPHSLRSARTMVHRKVMLITNVSALAEERGVFDPLVPVRSAPTSSATERAKFRLFNIFFVFGETRQATYGSTAKDYVLIGNAQSFSEAAYVDEDAERNPANVVEGWVPKNRVAFWNTREAIEWDRASTMRSASPRRTDPARVYVTPPHAVKVLKGLAMPNTLWLFEERLDENGETTEFKPHHTRYPLLEWEPGELNDDEGNVIPKKLEENQMLKIGCIGGYAGLTAGQIDDLKRQLQNLAKMISTTELLFVIDGTGSMDRYFDEVARVVRTISARAKRTSRQTKVAVAFYNDTVGRPAGHNPVVLDPRAFPLRSFGGNGLDALLWRTGDRLKVPAADFVAKYRPVSGGDPRELVFRGIKEAVERAGFTRFARKLVVVMGDCGDRLDDDWTTTDELAVVSRLLPEGQAPIGLYAVQVGSPSGNAHTRAFRDQMRTIVRLLNQKGNDNPEIQRSLGEYATVDEEELAEILDRRAKELEQEAEIKKQMLEKVARTGQSDIGPELEAILDKAGVDLAQLRGQKTVQVFQAGYMWRYDLGGRGIPQVRSRLMLSRATIEDIKKLLETLVKQAVDPTGFERPVKAREALVQLVQEAVGDDADEKLSFEENIRKKGALTFRSPLFRKPLNSPFSPRFSRQEMIEIRHRLDLLRDILEGKRRTWKRDTVQISGQECPIYTAVGDAEPYNRWFLIPGSGVDWCWLDFEEEMP